MKRTVNHTLEQTIEAWGAMVYRVALAYCGNAHDASDVFQNTFLKRHLHSGTFTDADHEKAWLIRVAINCSNSILRQRENRLAEPLESPAAEAKAASDSMQQFESESGTAAQDVMLERALATLSPKQRAVVHLFYYEGYSTTEIAKIIGDAPATVRSHLHRARKALRIELEDTQ